MSESRIKFDAFRLSRKTKVSVQVVWDAASCRLVNNDVSKGNTAFMFTAYRFKNKDIP
jgi:hypothetical protein